MTDLWPDDFEFARITTPLSIMRVQAALLGQKTRNIVKAEVVPDNSGRRSPKEKEIPDVLSDLLSSPLGRTFTEQYEFVFRFYIVAPALGNYHYRLFTAGHSILLYPVAMLLDKDIVAEFAGGKSDTEDEPIVAQSEREFVEILRSILASQKTRQVVKVLMSQAIDGSVEGDSE